MHFFFTIFLLTIGVNSSFSLETETEYFHRHFVGKESINLEYINFISKKSPEHFTKEVLESLSSKDLASLKFFLDGVIGFYDQNLLDEFLRKNAKKIKLDEKAFSFQEKIFSSKTFSSDFKDTFQINEIVSLSKRVYTKEEFESEVQFKIWLQPNVITSKYMAIGYKVLTNFLSNTGLDFFGETANSKITEEFGLTIVNDIENIISSNFKYEYQRKYAALIHFNINSFIDEFDSTKIFSLYLIFLRLNEEKIYQKNSLLSELKLRIFELIKKSESNIDLSKTLKYVPLGEKGKRKRNHPKFLSLALSKLSPEVFKRRWLKAERDFFANSLLNWTEKPPRLKIAVRYCHIEFVLKYLGEDVIKDTKLDKILFNLITLTVPHARHSSIIELAENRINKLLSTGDENLTKPTFLRAYLRGPTFLNQFEKELSIFLKNNLRNEREYFFDDEDINQDHFHTIASIFKILSGLEAHIDNEELTSFTNNLIVNYSYPKLFDHKNINALIENSPEKYHLNIFEVALENINVPLPTMRNTNILLNQWGYSMDSRKTGILRKSTEEEIKIHLKEMDIFLPYIKSVLPLIENLSEKDTEKNAKRLLSILSQMIWTLSYSKEEHLTKQRMEELEHLTLALQKILFQNSKLFETKPFFNFFVKVSEVLIAHPFLDIKMVETEDFFKTIDLVNPTLDMAIEHFENLFLFKYETAVNMKDRNRLIALFFAIGKKLDKYFSETDLELLEKHIIGPGSLEIENLVKIYSHYKKIYFLQKNILKENDRYFAKTSDKKTTYYFGKDKDMNATSPFQYKNLKKTIELYQILNISKANEQDFPHLFRRDHNQTMRNKLIPNVDKLVFFIYLEFLERQGTTLSIKPLHIPELKKILFPRYEKTLKITVQNYLQHKDVFTEAFNRLFDFSCGSLLN